MAASVTRETGTFTLPNRRDIALILAAPDMLAELKAAHGILDAMVGYDIKYLNTNEGAIFDIPKTCAQVKAAIAKAEGQP
jgi:hypothetical protein